MQEWLGLHAQTAEDTRSVVRTSDSSKFWDTLLSACMRLYSGAPHGNLNSR